MAVATDIRAAVADAAARLYVSALRGLPSDVEAAIVDARDRETSASGRTVLETIVRNVDAATKDGGLVCQDTGLPVFLCRAGAEFPLHPAAVEEALRDGVERATLESSLRSNTVHPVTRERTGANVGHRIPAVHWEFVADGDGLELTCVPKGSGSESMSFLGMLAPADGVRGVKAFVLESVVGAGGRPCPPGIVGVGIGGSADQAMQLAKQAIARPLGTRNDDPEVAKLEDDLLELLNETGLGPMGLGGDVTALAVHVEHADTHISLNPVAVNYQCWAARRASARIGPDGVVDYEDEA